MNADRPMTDATLSTVTPGAIYVRFEEGRYGTHIRKWAHEPFDGATCFTAARPTEAPSVHTVRDRLAAWPNDAWDQDFRDFIDNEVLPVLASLSTVLGVEK